MFSLADIPSSFQWPVVVRLPRNGGYTEKRFTADFALLPQEDVDDILREVRAAAEEDQAASLDLLDRIWLGWGADVTDEDGQPLAVNEQNRRALQRIIPVRNAVMAAWLDAIAGKKAARKN